MAARAELSRCAARLPLRRRAADDEDPHGIRLSAERVLVVVLGWVGLGLVQLAAPQWICGPPGQSGPALWSAGGAAHAVALWGCMVAACVVPMQLPWLPPAPWRWWLGYAVGLAGLALGCAVTHLTLGAIGLMGPGRAGPGVALALGLGGLVLGCHTPDRRPAGQGFGAGWRRSLGLVGHAGLMLALHLSCGMDIALMGLVMLAHLAGRQLAVLARAARPGPAMPA